MNRYYAPSQRGPAVVHAKAVGSFIPKLTQKAFERYGFSAAILVTDWGLIVGAEIAQFTAPDRLKWPRTAGVHGEAEGADDRPGATLVLRVDPARALEIEYRRRQIVERVNVYFGYRAIADLRLVQAPVDGLRKPGEAGARSSPTSSGPLVGQGSQVDPLDRALARLGAAVAGRAPEGPGTT